MVFNCKELKKVLDEKNSSENWRGIYIWGAYEKSDSVVATLINLGGYPIVGYIDRKAPTLSEYNNIPVYSFETLSEGNCFVFVALNRYDKQIERTLYEYGYEEWKDYWYPYKDIHLDGTRNYQDKYGNLVVTKNSTPIDVVVRNGGVVKIETEKLNSSLVIRSYDMSCIEIGRGNRFDGDCSITASNGTIRIGEKNVFNYRCGFRTTCKGEINIGNMCTIGRESSLVSSLNAKIVVEDDCMMSYAVELRAGNSHNIIDLDTLENLDNNKHRDVILGQHIWVGMRSVLLNGVDIGSGSMVGANSMVVKKKYPNNVLIAGNPARILRNYIAWIRDSDDVYLDYDCYSEAVFDEYHNVIE